MVLVSSYPLADARGYILSPLSRLRFLNPELFAVHVGRISEQVFLCLGRLSFQRPNRKSVRVIDNPLTLPQPFGHRGTDRKMATEFCNRVFNRGRNKPAAVVVRCFNQSDHCHALCPVVPTDSYRIHFSTVLNSFFRNGVSRVRL